MELPGDAQIVRGKVYSAVTGRYYGLLTDLVNSVGPSPDQAFENLLEVKGILGELGIFFWLDGGTLLGAVRDGDFPVDDHKDVDLSTWATNKVLIPPLIERMTDAGFRLYHYWTGDERAPGKAQEVSFQRDGLKIDVFFYEVRDDVAWSCIYLHNQCLPCVIPLRLVSSFETMLFRGEEFSRPSDIDGYLTYRYGDWRTPVHASAYSSYDPKSLHSVQPDWEFWDDPAWLNEVTFCVGTFQREMCARKLLADIRGRYPTAKVLLADSSEEPGVYPEADRSLRVPFDCGVARMRNALLDEVETEFVTFLDDDFQFTLDTDLKLLWDALSGSRLDLIAGMVLNRSGGEAHYEGLLEIDGDVLRYQHGDRGEVDGWKLYDVVFNFFMARTNAVRSIRWDPNLKLAEHSIRGDQPVLIRRRQREISVVSIEELFPASRLATLVNSDRFAYVNGAVEVWTEVGWQTIAAVSVHRCTERMALLRTLDSVVECTEHHSLVVGGESRTPAEVGLGGRVENLPYPVLPNLLSVDEDWAWFMGFFLAEGHSSRKRYPTIVISNQDREALERCQITLGRFGIDSHLVEGGHRRDRCSMLQVRHSALYRNMFDEFYTRGGDKQVPASVFKWDRVSREAFMRGFIEGDGTKRADGIVEFAQKSAVAVQGLLTISRDFYPYHSVRQQQNQFGRWFKVNLYASEGRTHQKDRDRVRSLEFYDYDGRVYDIEVAAEPHSFAGGIGNVNLHNTDFFLRARGRLKVGYQPMVRVAHPLVWPPGYAELRKRGYDYARLMMSKHGVKLAVDFQGRIWE